MVYIEPFKKSSKNIAEKFQKKEDTAVCPLFSSDIFLLRNRKNFVGLQDLVNLVKELHLADIGIHFKIKGTGVV